MAAISLAPILLVNYKTTSRWVDGFVFELYTNFDGVNLTGIVGTKTSKAIWDGKQYNVQKGPIVFDGMNAGQTYYLRVGTATPFVGTINWQPVQAVVAGSTGTPSGSFSAVVTPTTTGVNFSVTVVSPPTDLARVEVVWFYDGTVPGSSTTPLGTFQNVTTFGFSAPGTPGQTITGWARLVNTANNPGAWQSLGSGVVQNLPIIPNIGGAKEINGNYTASAADNGTLLAFSITGNATLKLPSAIPSVSGGTWNIFIGIVPSASGILTVDPNGLLLDKSGNTLAVSPGQGLYISTNKTNYYSSRGLGALTGSQPYDVVAVFSGQPADGVEYIIEKFRRAVTFPANFSGSGGQDLTNAAASGSFTVKKNGTQCGSVFFSTSGVFTFSSTSGLPVAFAIDDYMTIVTPTPQDANLADVGITFAGFR